MLKKIVFCAVTILFLNCHAHAFEQSFLVKEDDQILLQEGDIEKRYAPCSTFKIPLSLIGFDSGILIDEMHPVWPFKEGYADWRDSWKQDQTPKSWMINTCVWYSQVLTQQLGMEKFQRYVDALDYGNKDLSGDKGKNNGLTNAWLSSSLEISSIEQAAFLQKMLAGKLPVKSHAITMTKNILFIEDLQNGWKLYGKTGTGYQLNADRTERTDLYHGWFIGWIEKGDRRIVFIKHISDDKKEEIPASLRAKADAKERLIKIINQL